jgi:hypothetical protein
MAILDNLRGLFTNRSTDATKLHKLASASNQEDKLIRTESSEVLYARKPLLKLEQIYYSDPVIFNGINFYVRNTIGPGFRIEADNPQVQENFEKWAQMTRLEGSLAVSLSHMLVYGNGFTELVDNVQHDRTVALANIDPKTMDLARDPQQRPLLDARGDPIGYIQTTQTGQIIKLPASKIAHFPLYTIGTSKLGIGLIEPLFKIAIIKLNIEEGLGQTIFRHGYPLAIATVGDDKHEPTPADIDIVHNELKGLSYKSDICFPHWVKLAFEKPSGAEKLKDCLEYYIDQECAGLGLPKAFITGRGEGSNKATLDIQSIDVERNIQMIQRKLSFCVEQQLFKRVAAQLGVTEVPRLVWNEVNPESLNQRIDRLTKEIQVGLLEPTDEMKKYIQQVERLPQLRTQSLELGRRK